MALELNTTVVGDTSYRAQLEEVVEVPAIRVGPRSILGEVIKVLHGHSFIRRGIRHCLDDEEVADGQNNNNAEEETDEANFRGKKLSDCRLCLLEPGTDVDNTIATIKAHFAATASEQAAESDNAVNGKKKRQQPSKKIEVLEATTRKVHFTYKNYIMPEILKKVLPKGVVALSGFEQVGHIAHVNLDDSHLPYRFIIGQVIIDCNADTVRTVVNKLGSIDSVFREFKMECIGGDPTDLTAEVKQYGCTFVIPYDKVYWNSRLGFEHHRLVSSMNAGDQLFDVMAGCGPFAVPAAQKGIIVHANDLNPESVKAMRVNADRNGIRQGKELYTYEMDGREYIEKIVREQFLEVSAAPEVVSKEVIAKGKAYDQQFAVLSAADKKCGKKVAPSASAIVAEAASSSANASSAYTGPRRHMSMNLPALAVQFLDVFTRPTWRTGKIIDKNMLIHVYTFSAAEDFLADGVVQVEQNIQASLAGGYVEKVTHVRDVAPNKQMVCVSFRLPPKIFGEDEPLTKKRRSEEATKQL